MALPDKPLSRKEKYLAVIAGQAGMQKPDRPLSRTEEYLDYIAENGGGGGGGESNFATFEIDYNGGALKTVQKASEIKALVDAGKVICGVCKNVEGDDGMTIQFNVAIVRFTQYANLMVVYAYDGENNQIITIPLSAATLNDVFVTTIQG